MRTLSTLTDNMERGEGRPAVRASLPSWRRPSRHDLRPHRPELVCRHPEFLDKIHDPVRAKGGLPLHHYNQLAEPPRLSRSQSSTWSIASAEMGEVR